MLEFFSASTNVVNSKRAIAECLEKALEHEKDLHCDLIIIHSAIGHNFKELLSEAKKICPGARIAGCTCAGIIGMEGADESMRALNVMAVKGPENEIAVTAIDSMVGKDSYKVCAGLAQNLKDQYPDINMVQLLASGFDVWPSLRAVEGIESVFGRDVNIFGGNAIDNMKGVSCYVFMDDKVYERGAVMIGFADPSLKVISHSAHGLNVIESTPFEVTKADDHIVFELNNQPAWKFITQAIGLPETSSVMDILPIAVFATLLPDELHELYGSKYVLSGTMERFEDSSIMLPLICEEGTNIWLARRDEEGMFEAADRMIKIITDRLNGRKPEAVFHADCILRGKFSFNRILKDEYINLIQYPICKGEEVPWLGFYSAGEFAKIGSRNYAHQFTSSLAVMHR